MKDKEKKINDLANTLYNRQHKYDLSNPFEVAKCVIDLGYRKLPEDSVVLSRKEYEKLKGRAEEVFNEMTERMKAEVKIAKKMGIVKGSKETAEKILNELYCTPKEQVENKIKELARFIGVEIKE